MCSAACRWCSTTACPTFKRCRVAVANCVKLYVAVLDRCIIPPCSKLINRADCGPGLLQHCAQVGVLFGGHIDFDVKFG